jgi:hypothetical protein
MQLNDIRLLCSFNSRMRCICTVNGLGDRVVDHYCIISVHASVDAHLWQWQLLDCSWFLYHIVAAVRQFDSSANENCVLKQR